MHSPVPVNSGLIPSSGFGEVCFSCWGSCVNVHSKAVICATLGVSAELEQSAMWTVPSALLLVPAVWLDSETC